MYITDFIKDNLYWEEYLKSKPYCISVKHDNGYIILSYNQIDSDFNNPIVKECRGLIIRESDYHPVCIPFYKFGNYGEGYVDKIDWNTARVQEKVDGSLIKVWYDNEWHVSTNGTIDASKAPLQSDMVYKNYYELFQEAAKNSNLDMDKLNKDYTYMFELTSPYNRIVVPYSKTELYHIGTRNNITLDELDTDIGVNKPKQYNLHSLDECIEAANNLPYSEEGYVVVDKDWHRNKVKSPAWVAIHHMTSNGNINTTRIIELIRHNEQGEFLNYFPEYTDDFELIKKKIHLCILYCAKIINTFNACDFETRKDLALAAKETKYPALIFSLYDNKKRTVEDWFWSNSNDKIERMIENE